MRLVWTWATSQGINFLAERVQEIKSSLKSSLTGVKNGAEKNILELGSDKGLIFI